MNDKRWIAAVLFLLAGADCTSDRPQRTPPTKTTQSTANTQFQALLTSLREDSNIAWVDVEGSSIFIGWKTIPDDFGMSNRMAAFSAHKALQDTAEVWSLRSWQQGWRPAQKGGITPICRTIAYGGKVQASTCK